MIIHKRNGVDLEERINEAAEAVKLNIRKHNRIRQLIRKTYTPVKTKQESDEPNENEGEEEEENS